MNRKGISPLIAAVLLIAFTMSIALLAGPFFTNTIQDTQQGQEEELKSIQSGLDVSLEYVDATYNTDNDKLSVTVKNSGDDPLNGFSVAALGDSPKEKRFNRSISPAGLETVGVNVSSEPESIRISAVNLSASTEVSFGSDSEENLATGSAPGQPTGFSLNN